MLIINRILQVLNSLLLDGVRSDLLVLGCELSLKILVVFQDFSEFALNLVFFKLVSLLSTSEFQFVLAFKIGNFLPDARNLPLKHLELFLCLPIPVGASLLQPLAFANQLFVLSL